MECTSTIPIDVTELVTGTTTPGDTYEYSHMSCSAGFSEGDIVISVFIFWILTGLFMWWLDSKIFGIRVKIRQ